MSVNIVHVSLVHVDSTISSHLEELVTNVLFPTNLITSKKAVYSKMPYVMDHERSILITDNTASNVQITQEQNYRIQYVFMMNVNPIKA